jgi:TonB family protein
MSKMQIFLPALLLVASAFSTPARADEAPAKVPTIKQVSNTLVAAPEPEFPMAERRKGRHGSGIYRLVVDPRNGEVTEVKVLKSTGFRSLDANAVMAFFKWRFRPNTVKLVDVPFEFGLLGYARETHY